MMIVYLGKPLRLATVVYDIYGAGARGAASVLDPQ